MVPVACGDKVKFVIAQVDRDIFHGLWVCCIISSDSKMG